MTIHTRLSGSIAAAALGLTAVLGTATPALAGPPEINQKDCEAAGGTFDRVKGVKSCTTTATRSSLMGPYSNYYGSGGYFEPTYQATWYEGTNWQDTTVQTQKGNGEVATQTTSALLSRVVVNQQCRVQYLGATYTVGLWECEAFGLYPVY